MYISHRKGPGGLTTPACLNYQHVLPNLQEESRDSYAVENIDVWCMLSVRHPVKQRGNQGEKRKGNNTSSMSTCRIQMPIPMEDI